MPYHTLTQIKEANQRYADREDRAYWFEKGAMRFFGTSVLPTIYAGRYFITSEVDPSDVKKYTIREALDTGQINTVGEFHHYATLKGAKHALKSIIAEGKPANG